MNNLDETMDGNNYNPLPPQDAKTFTWGPSRNDRNNNKSYEWNTVFAVQGRRGRQDVIRTEPGPSRNAIRTTSVDELFSCFITQEMINNVTTHTNNKIRLYQESNPQVQQAKYTYVHDTMPGEVRALFGLMYLRGVLRQNFQDIPKVFHHKSNCGHFAATMSKNRLYFLTWVLQFDDAKTREERTLER